MHWIDRVARALLKRGKKHVIASGISISGHIHVGHSNDVFIADGIRRAVEESGGKATALWYADDYDPMRRIPWPLNQGEHAERYRKYLGMPYIDIPSPDPEYENFVEYFSKSFVDSLRDFGVKVKVYSGAKIYRSGKMSRLVKTALENAGEIRKILNRYRSTPLPDDWLPYDAICEKCGKIATTKAFAWDGSVVKYRCEGCDYAPGCGHEGESDYTNGEGKLTWRVEWPARWKLLGVTCEPFGKDHAVAGGSYDTGRSIAKRIFNYDAPYPVPYEWVSFRGDRMSSSRGVVFTLPQWLEIAEPELLRYFIFRSKSMKAKDFDPGLPLLDLYDEFDMIEQVYFDRRDVAEPKRKKQYKRIYELSLVGPPPIRPVQRLPFRFAAVLCQVTQDEQHAIEIMTSKGILAKPSGRDIRLALIRLRRARNWVSKYAPERLRFRVLKEVPVEAVRRLTEKQKEGLARLADDLSSRDYTPVELHNRIYEIGKSIELKPSELFKAVYLALLGRESGPRVGNFVSVLDREFVIGRFRDAVNL